MCYVERRFCIIIPMRPRRSSLPGSRRVRSATGFTLTDYLIVLCGVVPAIGVCHYVHGGFWTVYVLTLVFGIGLWSAVFLWLMPILDRRREAETHSDDGKPPAA